MKLERAEIERLIPHSGRMCLLDAVLEWDTQRIVCIANLAQLSPNPLASAGQLSPLCLIEYAAQATAIHAGLNSGRREDRQGRLIGVDSVTFVNQAVLATANSLNIQAQKLVGNNETTRYGFDIHAARGLRVRGQMIVTMLFET